MTGNSSSRLDRVGRDGFIDLGFVRAGARTILVRRRCAHPLQALEPARAPDGSLCLMLLNSGGGIIGGDHLRTSVDIDAGASAVLITASAGKVYRSAGPSAYQETNFTLGLGAAVEFLPDHLIPHPGARFRQSVRVQMSAGSRAILFDAVAAGRIGRGERWRFDDLSSETIVNRCGKLLYLSRSRIAPEVMPPDRLGLAEDYTYLASFVIAGDRQGDWQSLTTKLDRAVVEYPGVFGGASEIAGGGCSVRFMAHSADDLRILTAVLWGIARREVLAREPFDLRKL